MPADRIRYEVRDGVAHLVLNRPDELNVLDFEAMERLLEVVTWCEAEAGVRAVLLRGDGPTFCGGGDVKYFAAHPDLPGMVREMATVFHTAMSRLARLDKPVVCAAHGFSAGGGLSLACAADLTLAAESARFTLAYTAIGITLDGGSSFFLPRLIGLRKATELALTNRAITAREAYDLGIVTEVVPDDGLQARAEEVALRLASGPTWAYGRVKALLRDGLTETLETQLERETRTVTEAVTRHDGREGIAAFAEKRRAAFTGL